MASLNAQHSPASETCTICKVPLRVTCGSAQAELAERDFAADRGEVVVISMGAVEGKVDVVSAQERKAAEDKNRHK